MQQMKAAKKLIEEWAESLNLSNTLGAMPFHLKKIIDWKTYNTETATLLTTYSYDNTREDYAHFWEYLYQTKAGKFFLVGEGMSEWTPYCARIPGCNEYARGYILLPLELDQVKKWLEFRGLVDDYEYIFGCPTEAEGDRSATYTFTLRMPSLLSQNLKDSLQEKESIQSFIQKSIESEILRRRQIR